MPTIDELRVKANALQAEYESLGTDPTATLSSKVLLAYGKKVSTELSALLSTGETTEVLTTSLTQFLKSNWDFIKGTALNYTALPQHPITQLLKDVALYLHEVDPDGSFVRKMMPGVVTDSLFLHNYPNLDASQDPDNILRTHILSDDAQSLLPVRLLTTTDVTTAAQVIANPYYDTFLEDPAMSPFLSEREKERLGLHSTLAVEVVDAKKNYELILNDKSNLLGHLRQLLEQLRYNSVEGVGSELSAGLGAYLAIAAFNDYYKTLGEINQSRIPEPVKKEIDLLISLSSDPARNTAEHLSTCIASRRRDLERSIVGHESILSGISLSEGTGKESIVTAAKTRFETAKLALKTALDGNLYTDGHDTGNITSALLHRLGVSFSFASLQDLDLIRALNTDEITDIFSDPALRNDFIRQVGSLETLIIFSVETSPEKLQALLKVVASELMRDLVKDSDDLAALLNPLDTERCRLICEALKDVCPALQTIPELLKLLAKLPPDHRIAVIKGLGANINALFATSGSKINKLLIYFPFDVRASILDSIIPNLPTLITDITDFQDLLPHLAPDQHERALDVMRTHIPDLIISFNQFESFYITLNTEAKDRFFHDLKTKIPGLITSNYALSHMLKILTPEQRTSFIADTEIPAFITSAQEFNGAFRYLSPEQRVIIFELIKTSIPPMIQSGESLKYVLEHLDQEQRNVVFAMVKSNLPRLIQSGKDFNEALIFLTAEQREIVFNDVRPHLGRIIRNAGDLNLALMYLSPEQRKSAFSAPDVSIAWYVKSAHDFKMVVTYFDEEERRAAYELCKDTLAGYIRSSGELKFVFEYLEPAQRTELYNSIKTSPSRFIRSSRDFSELCTLLPAEECQAMFELIKDRRPPIVLVEPYGELTDMFKVLNIAQRTLLFNVIQEKINRFINQDVFRGILEYLTPDQRTVLYEKFKAYIPSYINSPQELSNILAYLTPKQRTPIFETVKDNMLAKIRTALDVWMILAHLTSEQQARVFKTIEPTTPELINSAEDLGLVFRHLNTEQRTIIFAKIREKIPGFITTAQNVNSLFTYLTPEQRTEIFTIEGANIAALINKPRSLLQVLEHLSLEQRAVIFNSVKDKLPEFINSTRDLANVLFYLTSEQSATVLHSVQDRIAAIISSADDLRQIFAYLNAEQNTVILNTIKLIVPNLLLSVNDWLLIAENLTTDQQTTLLEALTRRLPELINSITDLRSVLQPLTVEQRALIYPSLRTIIAAHINSAEEFKNAFEYLTPEQRTPVFAMMSARIPEWITSANDLNQVLQYLNPEEKTIVFNLMKPQVAPLISDILTHQVSSRDVLLTRFVREARDRLDRVNSGEDFFALKTELTSVLASVSSPQVQAVRRQIDTLRGHSTFFNKKGGKAGSIEDALCDIPLARRGKVLSEASNPVQEALARHRLTGVVYRTPSGEIDLMKATERFRALKRQFGTDSGEPGSERAPSRPRSG